MIMKREYMRPELYCEKFVASEYVAACYSEKISCMNMNAGQEGLTVYVDANKNGILDSGETTKFTKWNFKNDCNTNGDESGKNHSINPANLLNYEWVIVHDKKTGKNTAAILDYAKVDKDVPHFISIKKINASV